MTSSSPSERQRPLSPNIQLYRPQLTSMLSILNRLTGVFLSVSAIALVIWLLAATAGPKNYAVVEAMFASCVGKVMLFACTFAFFLHFLGGIRHLVWDTAHGFELRMIYLSGWTVVVASVVMTAVAWIASLYIGG